MIAALALMAIAVADPIHSVTDISKDFSFYFDGRFAAQYIEPVGGRDVRNWGTLSKFDLSNVNLVVLQQSGTPLEWPEADVNKLLNYVRGGGGALIIGDGSSKHLNTLAQAFGASFSDKVASLPPKEVTEARPTNPISLPKPEDWSVIVHDSTGEPLLVRRDFGAGRIMLGSRGIFGHRPDFSDPINKDFIQPQMQWLAANKKVDPSRPPNHQRPENERSLGGLTVRYADYLEDMAEAIAAQYSICYPVVREITGVPPSDGMLLSLLLLPTGGAGFSSGREIGIGVWWGGFPENVYPIREMISHEVTHSWVLPHPEPLWNEGLATYIGIEVGRRLGHKEEAEQTLANWIANAEKGDPGFKGANIAKPGVPHAVAMGKPMWIWEQLRAKHGSDLVARYFRAKRLLAPQDRYTADDSVAVLSVAAKADLFPWFKEHGIDVDRSRTNIK